MKNTSESFYGSLSPLTDFQSIVDIENYVKMPDDWYVAITDVAGSTSAIENGRYKEVNTVGASSIIAILNLNRNLSLPFVFGGDGAVVCIPPSLYKKARKTLAGIKKMAKEGFGFELRIGLVPVKDIHSSGRAVLVAKYRVSKNYDQAMFAGGGIPYAEHCIKESSSYSLELSEEKPEADFDGLQCRWENVPGSRGEVVSIIVHSLEESPALSGEIYSGVIKKIEEIYGEDKVCMPVRAGALKLSLDNKILNGELNVKFYNRSRFARFAFNIYQKLSAIVGEMLFATGVYLARVHWGDYKEEVAANTDYKKFDDQLRLVLSGSAEQREMLKDYLEEKYLGGNLVYGIHHSPQALITCMIFDYSGQHIHLIDSDNGGYALAAKELKGKLTKMSQLG